MHYQSKVFRAEDLILIGQSEDYQHPDHLIIGVGDHVRLNSGGPVCTVVDVQGDSLTMAYRSGVEVKEIELPRVCVHAVVVDS